MARRVVLLTDGQVTNTEDVIALVRKHSTHTRVFTFGIGEGASHHLVRGLARAGEGASELIAPGERIGPKVLRQLARVVAPGLTDLRVEGDGLADIAPHYLPPVFAGERLLVYGRLTDASAGAVTLRGQGPAGEVRLTVVPETLSSGERIRIVGTLWARAAIRDLEEGRSAFHDRRGSLQQRTGGDRVKDEIVRLAKAYGLASRETSFVAVEERATPAEGQAQLRRVPIALTRGWGGTDQRLARGRSRATGAGAIMASLRLAAPASAAPAILARSARPASTGVLGRWAGAIFGAAPSPPGDAELEPSLEAGDAHEPAVASPSRPLDRLAALQRADGSWDLSNELAAALGVSQDAIERRAVSRGWATTVARQAWATALALAWLEARASADRDEWALLADKARDWLRQKGGAGEPDAWMREAQEFVGSLQV